MKITSTLFFILFISCLISCSLKDIPSNKLQQAQLPSPIEVLKDSILEVQIKNPIKCPIRVWITSKNEQLLTELNTINPIEIKALSDTLISIPNTTSKTNLSYKINLGSTTKKIEEIELELPFPKNKTYKIIQGNNTNYTHSTNYSKYALDINLKINDTICAATNGFVVGVIEGYKYGGENKKWRNYGNFITIYNSDSGIFTQYVHLVNMGSFVKVGDSVKAGQPIGLSGKTGQTNIEHLHFNCLIPNKNDLKSIPYIFKQGYNSEKLKKGSVITNIDFKHKNTNP